MTTVVAIKAIAERVLSADADGVRAKMDYLREMVSDLQQTLGGTPRQRAGKATRLTPEERSHQLSALVSVNERFYGAVMEAARARLSAGPDKGKRLNAAIGWARTTVKDIRSYIRAGNDIRTVGVAKLTLGQLRKKAAPRPASAAVLRRRMVDRGKDLVAATLAVIETDPIAARTEIELIMSQLATQLLNLGDKPTRNVQEAASQHKPLRVRKTVFVPTETQIQRQLENPS